MHQTIRRQIPTLVLIFSLVGIWILNYLTPMHSDDFRYKMQGFAPVAHWNHYISWSGRVVADYISPLLLHIPGKWLLASVQTLGLFSLIMVIFRSASEYQDPYASAEQKIWVRTFIVLLFLLSIPHFGEITMWVVGSANYLWPALIYSLFLMSLMHYVHRRKVATYTYFIALLAGCSNENAAVVLVGVTALLIVWQVAIDKKMDWRLLVIFALIAIGAAILIGAPGNYIRLQHPAFEWFRELTFIEKAQYHFSRRMPRVIHKSKLGYSVWTVLFIWLLIWHKPKLMTDHKKPTSFGMMLVFAAMAVAASAVQVASPSGATRAMMPSFVFLVFSITFGLYTALENPRVLKWLKRGVMGLSLITVLVFLEVFPTYTALSKQESIRNEILESNTAGKTKAPDFYIRWLVTSSYRIDTFYSAGAMRRFFDLEQLDIFEPAFDYSIITTPGRRIDTMHGPAGLRQSWLNSEKYLLDTIITLETDDDMSDGSTSWDIRVTDYFGRSKVYKLSDPVNIDSRAFVSARVGVPRFLIKDYEIIEKTARPMSDD